MKTKHLMLWPLAISSVVLLGAMSGCIVPPPPGVAVDVAVTPDYCFWDGDDYFGWYGGQYYYWGGGGWIICDRDRLHRVHDWEGAHPDWRNHVTETRMEPQRSAHVQQSRSVEAPPARHYYHEGGHGDHDRH
jgi:hypothetical protein